MAVGHMPFVMKKTHKKIHSRHRQKRSPSKRALFSKMKVFSVFKLSMPGLVITFLFAITLSLLNVTRASAPNPGHTWSEMGDVAVTVAQGGTGAATLGSTQILVGSGTGAVTSTTTVAVNRGGTGIAS